MTDISDDAVRAFMAAEVPGILDEHLDLGVKSIDGDKIRAGLAAALPYLLEQDRTEVIRPRFSCRPSTDGRTQQCTFCGAPGWWAADGFTGYFAAPNGHAVRDDGTLECPRSLGDRFADAARWEQRDGQRVRVWDEWDRELS